MEEFNSNIFSIEEKNREDKNLGFIKERMETTLINDGHAAKDHAAINKMCTSIPTPFARMFLFRTAFKEIQKKEEINKGSVHQAAGLYNYLVSDCLDMLEFIFYYGSQPEFNVVKWNRNTELELLSGSSPRFRHNESHDRLANALKDHLTTDDVLQHVNTIYLFTWNDRPEDPNSKPIVVGGTSPFSLVYTSPNWIREKDVRHWQFSAGNAGSILFDNDPTHLAPPRALCERSNRFKEYIYKMWFAYQGHYPSLKDFESYIEQSWELYDKDTPFGRTIAGLRHAYGTQDFQREYDDQLHSVKFDNGHATHITTDPSIVGSADVAYAIPLRCRKPDPSIVHDDYKIKCDRLPMEKSGINAPEEVQPPLVLDVQCDLTGASYYQDQPWSAYSWSMPPYQAENPNYWERTLPGTREKYPYLRIEDFLEDKIIGLADRISNKHFITGNNGDVFFIPPLKRTFFKFFGLETFFKRTNEGVIIRDDNGTPLINNEIYTLESQSENSVTVTLRIPVQSDKVVTMTKTYHYYDPDSERDSEIVYYDDADAFRHFNLSVFPFYQLQGNAAQYNKYNVMLGYVGDVDLIFYRMDDLNTPLNVTAHSRTITTSINTKYYDVNETFDLIEVVAGGIHGLVIPLFQQIRMGAKTMVFCVDLGTTNTHIAYGDDNDNTVDDVTDFFYEESDSQVVSLYDIGGYLNYKPTMKREFVPERIFPTTAAQNGGSRELTFPIRTSVCANKNWLNNTQTADYALFGDANVGFFFLNEEQNAKGENVYRQNIKWSTAGKSLQLRSTYLEEIMWMIKNKAVLNGASVNFYFYFTYPQSMAGNEIAALYRGWENARLNVKAGDPQRYNMRMNAMLHPIEGIVPWYAYRNAGLIESADIYLNIDIGGGTMDMVYQDPDYGENNTYSARFAANDLWGDGIDEGSAIKKQNAFIRDYTQSDSFPDAVNLRQRYDAFFNNAGDSADVISFLFKYENEYNFSAHLQRSPLITLLLMHIAAVSYYVGLVLKKDDLKVPHKIGFTGMGSLYLNILSPVDRNIAEIIKSVFRYQKFPEEQLRGLEVVLTPNPKVVTARGGVIFHHTEAALPHSERTVWGYAGESDMDVLREKEVSSKMNAVLELTSDYVDYFSSNEFLQMKSKLNQGWVFKALNKSEIMELAERSFRNWCKDHNSQADDIQKDPLFFWPLKDLLFKYGFKILNQ